MISLYEERVTRESDFWKNACRRWWLLHVADPKKQASNSNGTIIGKILTLETAIMLMNVSP